MRLFKISTSFTLVRFLIYRTCHNSYVIVVKFCFLILSEFELFNSFKWLNFRRKIWWWSLNSDTNMVVVWSLGQRLKIKKYDGIKISNGDCILDFAVFTRFGDLCKLQSGRIKHVYCIPNISVFYLTKTENNIKNLQHILKDSINMAKTFYRPGIKQKKKLSIEWA